MHGPDVQCVFRASEGYTSCSLLVSIQFMYAYNYIFAALSHPARVRARLGLLVARAAAVGRRHVEVTDSNPARECSLQSQSDVPIKYCCPAVNNNTADHTAVALDAPLCSPVTGLRGAQGTNFFSKLYTLDIQTRHKKSN